MAKYFSNVNTLEELRKLEIVGCWIWIDGNTYGYKDVLKEIGFKWAREKKKWHFHTEAFRKKVSA